MWASDKTRAKVCLTLSVEGVAAGPCLRDAELVADAHLRVRNMISVVERPDGSGPPVLVPGNPVKLVGAPDAADFRMPWLGEHTDEVLEGELGLTAAEIDSLRSAQVIG